MLLFGTLCVRQGMAASITPDDHHLAVIVGSHSDIRHMDRDTLRNVFLKRVFIDRHGQSLIAVNLPSGNPVRHAFSQAVLRMPESQLRSYWNRQYFQGVSPPYVLASQRAIVEFVARTLGGIGYVQPCAVDARVRVVAIIELHEATQPRCTPTAIRPAKAAKKD
ncbi:hypothetical protein [Oleiagrimonas sp. C23AA]|uniref:hypothetical protein n=1 Tax=Oleiagrimonas sp. C23AA TaxID=2719047 RepID=UPI001422378E|nr:hypothetical protein [Oleiagrimonas sp. C23AA]NII10569.1 hypothetical protein [Oleiagrimonas sp. C23AA]